MIRRIGTSVRGNASAVSRLGDGSRISIAAPWWLSGGIAEADVAGVWQSIRSASLAASYLRLAGDEGYANIDPLETGLGVAPTRGADGSWGFSGSQCLKTGVVPAENYSMTVQYSDVLADGSTQCVAGAYNGSSGRLTLFPNVGDQVYWGYGRTYRNNSPRQSSGNLAVTKDGGYRNGVLSVVGSWTPFVSSVGRGIAVGAQQETNLQYFLTGNIQAIAIYKTTLTADQVLAVSTAMANL